MPTSYRCVQLKNLRASRAWSQEQLAKMAGLDVRTIQRLEKGESASFESLKSIAAVFNMAVNDLLGESHSEDEQKKEAKSPNGEFLVRVHDGVQLFAQMNGAHAFAYNNDSLDSSEDTELVADFLQDLHDWGELADEIGPGEKIRTAHEYTGRIKLLEEKGLWVFAGQTKRNLVAAKKPVEFSVFTVYVLLASNPIIVTLDPSKASVFAASK